MDGNVEKLLNVLEPTIDEKCMELKKKTKEKMLQKLFAFSMILFLLIPSALIFLGINIIYFIIITAFVISVFIFTMLPFIIKIESRGICYE